MKFSKGALGGGALAILFSTQTPFTNAKTGTLQSGPHLAPVYAATMIQDVDNNRVYVAGLTYDNGVGPNNPTSVVGEAMCFVSLLDTTTMTLGQTKIHDVEGASEFCRAMTVLSNKEVAIMGTADKGSGVYGSNSDQLGWSLILEGNDLSKKVGGHSALSNRMPYAQAIVAGPDETFYAAYMQSLDDVVHTGITGQDYPNFTYQNPRGAVFEMVVEKFVVTDDNNVGGGGIDGINDITNPNKDLTIESVWKTNFPVDPEPDGSRKTVRVAGMIWRGNQLIVAGNTRAEGQGYGLAEGDDEDGYITIINPNTGALIDGKSSERYGTEYDDTVTGVCIDPADENVFYIVGATKGDMDGIPDDDDIYDDVPEGSLWAFIRKVDLTNLHTDGQWTAQFGAIRFGDITTAYAVDCVVGNGSVYVAGVVQGGAGMIYDGTSFPSGGRDDIWLAAVSAMNGEIQWVNQAGSAGNDNLARSKAVVMEPNGDILVAGDTSGTMGRNRQVGDKTDLFVMRFDGNTGDYQLGSPTPAPVAQPTNAPVAPVAPPTSPPIAPVAPPTNPPILPPTNLPDHIIAIQTGPDTGPTYAGGMVYDRDTNAMYVTGATYGKFENDVPGLLPKATSYCFFGRLNLPDMTWEEKHTFGTDKAPEACNTLALTSFGGSPGVALVGSTESGGLLTDLTTGDTDVAVFEDDALQAGIVVDLKQEGSFQLLGGATIAKEDINFPIGAIANDQALYVVSMTSTEVKLTPDGKMVEDQRFPNLTTGGIEKFGGKYMISVEKLASQRFGDEGSFAMRPTLKKQWEKPFDTANAQSVYVGGMVQVGVNKEDLIIVGSTRSKDETRVNGIMVKISITDGNFVAGQSDRSVAYADANGNKDVFLSNACPDKQDPDFFYVVGTVSSSVKGNDNRNAFVSRIHLKTLSTAWTKEFPVVPAGGDKKKKAAATALGCDMIDGVNFLYVAGNVENGAYLIESGGESAGRDDVFVSKVKATNGEVMWVKQIGSNGDDRIAHGGGVIADSNGNAVIFGDTTGDFFRPRTQDADQRFNDLFFILVDSLNGDHPIPLVGPVIQQGQAGGSRHHANGATPHQWFKNLEKGVKNNKGARVGLIIFLVILVLGILFCVYRRWCRKMKQLDSGMDSYPKSLSLRPGEQDHELSLTEDPPTTAYHDDPNAVLPGNFHKKYSDLKGGTNKNII